MNELKRIRRVSGIMKGVCTVAVVAIPLASAIFWAVVPPATVRALPGVNYDIAMLPPVNRALAFLVTMIPGVIGIYGLVALRRLFDAYRRGAIFAVGNALHLRAFAVTVVAGAIARIAIVPVLSIILSWHNPPGSRALSIAIGSEDIGALFAGLLFLVVAWIMAEAQRLADDHAQIV